jgi:hypothetical protein
MCLVYSCMLSFDEVCLYSGSKFVSISGEAIDRVFIGLETMAVSM